MSEVSRLGLLLVTATAMGCVYPAVHSGAGGAQSSAGTQGSGGAASATASGGRDGSATGATSSSSSPGGSGGSNDAGVPDAPVSHSDAPAGGSGGGGIGAGGTTHTGVGGSVGSGGATGTTDTGGGGGGGNVIAGGTTSAGGATTVVDCGSPPSAPNGQVSALTTTYGSTATYNCQSGYSTADPTTLTCQADGTWSGVAPTCSPVSCGPAPSAANVALTSTGTTYGATASYTCVIGYFTVNQTSITCRADGTWSGVAPRCSLVDCGTPPKMLNGTGAAPGTLYGSIASYTCDAGYTFSNSNTTRTCLDDGTWSLPAPACTLKTFTVTVNKGGYGTGTITSSSGDVSCGVTCTGTSASYTANTNVLLTATPSPSTQHFAGWTSSPTIATCTGMTATCSFTLTQATTVTANFSPPPNYAFVTSTAQSAASLGGLSGADALCAARAAAGGLPGTYRAWLSTPTVSARSRLGNASGWIRPDGNPIFNTIDDIGPNRFYYPLRLDEYARDVAVLVGTTPMVLTNTWYDGSMPTGESTLGTCNNFSSDDGTSLITGCASEVGSNFTYSSRAGCTTAYPLYCFGVDNRATLAVTRATGRYAFLSTGYFVPGGGIAGVDALCQTEATAAGLPGTYRALIAQDGASAASRFDATGLPWVRPDGIRITQTASALFTTPLFDATPNVSADQTRYFATSVWSGATNPTTPGTAATTCNGWLSSTGSATSGFSDYTATNWFFNYWSGTDASPCTYQYAQILCLQI